MPRVVRARRGGAQPTYDDNNDDDEDYNLITTTASIEAAEEEETGDQSSSSSPVSRWRLRRRRRRWHHHDNDGDSLGADDSNDNTTTISISFGPRRLGSHLLSAARHIASFMDEGAEDQDQLLSSALQTGAPPPPPRSFLQQQENLLYSSKGIMALTVHGIPHAIFANCSICVSNCDQATKNAVLRFCMQLGAQTNPVYSENCTHLITSLAQGQEYEQALFSNKVIVSLQWFEECITAKQYIHPSKPFVHFPVQSAYGIQEMKDLVISVTGFVGDERNDLKYLIKISGARYSGTLSKKDNTHLVCWSLDGEKYRKALEWNIQIVSKRWLMDCIAAWCKLPEQCYHDIEVNR